MRRGIIIYGLAGILLTLCPLGVWADITHNFHTKYNGGTLVAVDGTHFRSTNDAIVYTSGGTAELFYDVNHPYGGTGAKMCFNLLMNGDCISTSPSLNKVNGLTINHIPNNVTLSSSKVVVELSLDGSDWSSVTPTVSYGMGSISVEAPENSYYVRIRSVSSTKVSILGIVYSIGECACFPYVP